MPNLINKSNESQNNWKPLVIIIPLRLGLNDVNTEYIEQLKVQKMNCEFWKNSSFLVMLSFTSNTWIYWWKTKSCALFYWLFRKG
jgi:hypothetical protein